MHYISLPPVLKAQTLNAALTRDFHVTEIWNFRSPNQMNINKWLRPFSLKWRRWTKPRNHSRANKISGGSTVIGIVRGANCPDTEDNVEPKMLSLKVRAGLIHELIQDEITLTFRSVKDKLPLEHVSCWAILFIVHQVVELLTPSFACFPNVWRFPFAITLVHIDKTA